MFNIRREQQGNTLILRLSGEVNEAVNLDKEMGPSNPSMVVNCKEISRINSVGVKAWVRFFQELVAKNVQVRFTECSPAVVEQLNLIMNFTAGAKVESIYVPFVCTKTGCKKALVGLFTVEELKALKFDMPPVKCTKCGSDAVFDDLPEEYFRFATRAGQ